MKRLLALLVIGMLLLNMMGNATAQDEHEECDQDCVSCRDTNFYYVLIAGLVIFVVLFYIRNRNKIE